MRKPRHQNTAYGISRWNLVGSPTMKPFQKILIANRGDSALRVIRACRDMGISPSVVHSTADEDAMHVRLADEAVCIGSAPPSQSYLNIPAILSAAEVCGVDAIHPGVGFLSENARFAKFAEDSGFVFIGPSPGHIERMGDKAEARHQAEKLGWPLVPGSDGCVARADVAAVAAEVGYPVLLKAVAGGGGRGITVVEGPDAILESFDICAREASMAFGDDRLYVEKYLRNPRHIEFQILADGAGHCHVYTERDCSIQRRHQKVIEETPSPGLDDDKTRALMASIRDGIIKMGYRGVGTLEFLFEDGAFTFIEMNTRLQVEHTITEVLHNIDLVVEQIRVAQGERLDSNLISRITEACAMEARVVAEDPVTFMPFPGTVNSYHPPGGAGVRVDSHIFASAQVPPYYDSLVSKLVTDGPSRDVAQRRMARALTEYVIEGIKTNLPSLLDIVNHEDFCQGQTSVHWLETLQR